MRTVLTFLLPLMLLCCGQIAWATPEADARLIAKRGMSISWSENLENALRSYFVTVYFRPISGRGVTIAEKAAFQRLIPDEDIAPYLEQIETRVAKTYQAALTPEYLATIAAILRQDETTTLDAILAADYEDKVSKALQEARANATRSDDPAVAELEDFAIKVEALSIAMKDGGSDLLAQSVYLGLVPLMALEPIHREILKIEKASDNPVTLAAIREKGVLHFANPTQRQSLIRQYGTQAKPGGGIQFIKPPKK